ncbi:MAG: hypothetical protein ACYC0B_06775 [Gemmatimonadaceae bacterium]
MAINAKGRRLTTLLLTVVAVAAVTLPVSAQQHTKVALVLKDSFPSHDLLAMIRIDSERFVTPVVALRAEAATPELLAIALRRVTTLERRQEITGVRTLSFEILRTSPLATPTEAELRRARTLLSHVRAAKKRDVAGIGRVRHVSVTVILDRGN